MTSPVDPVGENALLIKEMRRLVHLRWFAAGAALVAALVAGTIGPSLWHDQSGWLAGLGLVILAYNAVFLGLLRKPFDRAVDRGRAVAVAWCQIVLDLIGLSLATAWTGGFHGPVVGFFVLHMVLSSLLLSALQAYLVAILSAGLVLAALAMTGQWPSDVETVLLIAAWSAVLLLTTFLTGRVASDLRARQTGMRVQHEQIRAILDTAIEGIVTINPQGIMLSANPAAERIFGYEAGELTGRRINELMPEPDRSAHDGYIDNYRRTGKAKIIGIGREVVGKRKDGSLVPLDLSISEVRLGDRTLFTGILRDITERKKSEEEILSMNQALQRHQQALIQSEKMVAMGQMAAGIVHEIGNPLASMDSLLQLVERHPSRLNEDTVQVLREQVSRIHQIIRQLTDFAHPNETAWEVRSVNQIVEATLDMMRFDRRLKRVAIERLFDAGAGDVRVMAHAFQQVLVNMIVNAVDAMNDVTAPQLRIATSRNDGSVVVANTDNGHGIAADHLPHLFEPFFTTKPIGRGTGLGLSISYSVIQRHGGDCEVESRVGVGTTFRILLPAVDGSTAS